MCLLFVNVNLHDEIVGFVCFQAGIINNDVAWFKEFKLPAAQLTFSSYYRSYSLLTKQFQHDLSHTVKKRHFPFWLIWTIWTKPNLAKLMPPGRHKTKWIDFSDWLSVPMILLSPIVSSCSEYLLLRRGESWPGPVPSVRFLPVVPPGHDKISGNCNKSVTTHSYAASGASSISQSTSDHI